MQKWWSKKAGVLLCAWLSMALMQSANADTRIVLDVSKSMAENDPENFRADAIELLIEALPNGEKAGIWTFGQFVNLLAPHQPVDNAWREQARTAIRQLKSPATRSNMGRALEEVSYDFLYSTYQGPTQVIFITDGQVDIAPNAEVNRVERDRIITQVLPKFAAANARLHTVSLSPDADQGLLKQMASQTNARYQQVANKADLAPLLVSLPAGVNRTSQVPLRDQGFSVDEQVREMTVLIYHDSGAVELASPNGQTTSAVAPDNQRWRVGPGFTQVTVSNPETGRWQINGPMKDASNIRVISDINVQWQQPATNALAEGAMVNVVAQLVDEQQQAIFTDADNLLTAEVRIDGQLVATDIQNGQILARYLPVNEQDEILIELSVDGGTFKRLMTRSFRFVKPYLSEVVLTERGYEWRLYPNAQLMSDQALDAVAEYPLNGTVRRAAFEQTPAGYYVWQFPYDQPEGTYEVRLKAKSAMSPVANMQESVRLEIPPKVQQNAIMTPEAVANMQPPQTELPPEPMLDEQAFVKDPILDFPELQADIVIADPMADPWQDEGLTEEESSGLGFMTYLLLTLPGLLVLAIAYLVYRRIEQTAKTSSSEEELILGGDEFSGLDDIDALAPDSDLDLAGIDDDRLPDPPMIDDIEEDLPTPDKTEAPSVAEEDMLDEQVPTNLAEEPEQPVEDPEEELFDISSIDDDLADLDLALDGDDPFADEEEKA